jgi:hypothetical protein
MTYVQNNGEKKIDWRVGPHESPVDRNQAGVNSSRSNIREGQLIQNPSIARCEALLYRLDASLFQITKADAQHQGNGPTSEKPTR